MISDANPRANRVKRALDDFFAAQTEVLEWGVAELDQPLPNAARLGAWVAQGLHAGLGYMQERLEERKSPRVLFPWARSAVLFALCQPAPFGTDTGDFKIAAYALGEDYHRVARRMLAAVEKQLREELSPGEFRFAGFSDTWPVFERDLAAEAGIGWRGKNACLINKRHGSGFLLAGFFLDMHLDSPATPATDFCGGCTACLDACPTDAIVAPGRVDANKCISYWTIEAKGKIPENLSEHFDSWIFGCDICQDVCPWNHKHKRAKDSSLPSLWPRSARDWLVLLRKGGGFQSRFKHTPLVRAGRRALLRNVLIGLRKKTADTVGDLLEVLTARKRPRGFRGDPKGEKFKRVGNLRDYCSTPFNSNLRNGFKIPGVTNSY